MGWGGLKNKGGGGGELSSTLFKLSTGLGYTILTYRY